MNNDSNSQKLPLSIPNQPDQLEPDCSWVFFELTVIHLKLYRKKTETKIPPENEKKY